MEKAKQIDIHSREYPSLLRQIQDPPAVLHYRGEWDPGLFYNAISVVGARKMTRYGEEMTDRIVGEIAAAGITVVSGFMYGIDARAHESAVDAGGKTIAVMPCGAEKVHPEYQEELYHRIIETGGLILSEYPGEMPPALWSYPRRNRIVAGLSPVLMVMEAGLKSGALITARIARKYNKKIYALPGPLTSAVSLGTARLLKQGAAVATEAADILKEYGILQDRVSHKKKKGGSREFSGIQRAILKLIARESMTADEITRDLGKPASQIGAELTVLTLKKTLSLRDGRYALAGTDGMEGLC